MAHVIREAGKSKKSAQWASKVETQGRINVAVLVRRPSVGRIPSSSVFVLLRPLTD